MKESRSVHCQLEMKSKQKGQFPLSLRVIHRIQHCSAHRQPVKRQILFTVTNANNRKQICWLFGGHTMQKKETKVQAFLTIKAKLKLQHLSNLHGD